MFTGKRYLTKGVQAEIPFELQLFMWCCIDNLPAKRDYFQVFELDIFNGKQHIRHFSELPKYSMEYLFFAVTNPVTAKVYVIDDENKIPCF